MGNQKELKREESEGRQYLTGLTKKKRTQGRGNS